MTLKYLRALGPAILAAVTLLALTAPAHATDNAPGPPRVSIKDLEDQGYTCEVVSLDHWQCTKPGSKTMICSDRGKWCIDKPRLLDTPVPGRIRPDNPAKVDDRVIGSHDKASPADTARPKPAPVPDGAIRP